KVPSRLERIRRHCRQPGIIHRATESEVVERLPAIIADAEQRMHFVIEKTTNTGGAHTGGFRFEIEDVPQHPAFPEKMAVTPGLMQSRFEMGNHPQRETRVRANVLV